MGYSWIDFNDILTINIFFLFKICVDGFLRSTYDDNEPMTISETSLSGSEGSVQNMAENGMCSFAMKQSTFFHVNDCFFFLVQLYQEAVLCKYNYYFGNRGVFSHPRVTKFRG